MPKFRIRPLKPCYAVVAYRWGALNEHQYLVYVGPSRECALTAATTEADDRGGKYGCAVYEFVDGTRRRLIRHAPSMCGETVPAHNPRIDHFLALGHWLGDYADGSVLLPDPAAPDTVKYTAVEAPSIVRQHVAEARADLAATEKVYAEAFKRANGALAAGAPTARQRPRRKAMQVSRTESRRR